MIAAGKKDGPRHLADYTEDPLSPFEHRRVRRTMDVVDDIEEERTFVATLKTRARAWFLMIGLAAATWTAVLTLKAPLRAMLQWLGGAGP